MKQLKAPPLCQLLKLAIKTEFPATREDIIAISQALNFKPDVEKFIKLFPKDQYFPSSDAFLELCEELELAIENGSFSSKFGDSSGLKLS